MARQAMLELEKEKRSENVAPWRVLARFGE
jgi:hypothetical protein